MADLILLVEGVNNLPSISKEGFLVEVGDSTFEKVDVKYLILELWLHIVGSRSIFFSI